MFGVQWSIQNYFVVYGCYKRVLSIVAFYKRIYLRNLTFRGILEFFSYLLVAEVFELRQCVIIME